MARTARGIEVLEKARELLSKARTADELRQAQSVVLPLKFGFSLEQIATMIGASKGWVSQLRTQLGRTTALASTYNLLHRHGWRKLAPDKRHPKTDREGQEEWKKNSQS